MSWDRLVHSYRNRYLWWNNLRIRLIEYRCGFVVPSREGGKTGGLQICAVGVERYQRRYGKEDTDSRTGEEDLRYLHSG